MGFDDNNTLEVPSHLTRYQRELHLLDNCDSVQREVTLGRRTGLYVIHGEIGVGNFSKVRLATHALLRERVAVKVVDKLSLDKRTQKMLKREMDNMLQLHHPNIIRLFEVMEDAARVCIVLEYAEGGELYRLVTHQGKLKEETSAKTVFFQITSAISHIHSKKLVHRDIKAENVFLFPSQNPVSKTNTNNINSTNMIAKLGDFGFSTVSDSSQTLTTFCGSPPYAAPELFTEPSYVGCWVDIWALGVLLYFITAGTMPFNADSLSRLKQVIISGSFQTPDFMSSPLKHLIFSLLAIKPTNRLKVDKILMHEWLIGKHDETIELYPESNENLPKLNPKKSPIESSSISLRNLSDDKFRVVHYMQDALGIPDNEFTKQVAKNQSFSNQHTKEAVTGIYRILMHRVQCKLPLENKDTAENKSSSLLLPDSGVGLRSSQRSSLAVENNRTGSSRRIEASRKQAESKKQTSSACLVL
ncbi:serine/threonine-protein kinase NIM1-like [Symsagittifera roscoffensis]|uniref:serine/threonine-protein kinase NIM1-like n=1 Tax=Symsagittifera roscoffensis TaxID=84072 RepID=UPI00307BA82D